MGSALRSENAELKRRLAATEKELEAARQANADSELRREEAEGHAQALQLQLDELLKQRSAQPKTVPEPVPPRPAPQPAAAEAAPVPPARLEVAAQRVDAESIIEEARARAQEEAEKGGDDEVEHWHPKAWVSSLHDGLAKVIIEPLFEHFDFGDGHDSNKARRTQLAFLRNLGKKCLTLPAGQDEDVVLELLNFKHSSLISRLASVLTPGICSLSVASTGAEPNAKFVAESLPDLSYGKLNSFFEGLEGLIGPPNPNLLDAMAQEHCAGPDAKLEFTTANYNICTLPPWEWYFVYDPDKGKAEVLQPNQDWPSERYPVAVVPRGAMRRYRKVQSVASFDLVFREKNQKLESFGAKKLQTVEFVASRLYTGPMYMKYNTALRMRTKDPHFVDLFQKLNQGNEYTTTLHVINSAIVKLGKITAQSKVYRGISGRTLPRNLMDPTRIEPRGGIELGFMSTTHEKAVAVHYAQQTGVVFEIQMGMIDRGADLSWLSQYPHEEELLFSPLTGCEITDLEVEGSLLVAKVRLSVNLTTPTIEQVIAKMQSANIQLLDNIRANVLQANPPPRVLLAIDGLRGTQAARDPTFFNEASNFRSATEWALSEQKEAFAVLADEELWSEVAEEGEAAFEALSVRMWNAALVSARSGEHAAAIKLLRQSMRRMAQEERGPPSTPRTGLGTLWPNWGGEGSPGVSRSMQRKKRMVAKIEAHAGVGAVGREGLAQEAFVSMAQALLPSMLTKQAELMFADYVREGSSTIELAEARELLEKLFDHPDASSIDRPYAKGAKPLFTVRAAQGRSKPIGSAQQVLPAAAREQEICAAVDAALGAASSEEQMTDVRLVARLLELGAPQPWPATLCHLVEVIDAAAAGSSAPELGTELVRRIVAALREDRMAVGEEVLVLQNEGCNLWKKANIQAHSPAPDGKSGCFYDVTFALDQADPVKGMPANKVLPVEEGGAGALLRAAAAAGDNGLVEALLMAGVHLYEADPDGNTALHAAAGNGHADVYKTLMEEADKFPAEKGPPAHAFTKNVRGMRAFDYMVQGHHIRCTRLMRPSAQDEDYISAAKEMKELPELLSAACKGDAEQLRRAVENVSERGEGVDSARTSSGMTALMLACRKGPSSKNPGKDVEDKVRALLENGANVNAKSTAGCVALAFAAEAGNPRVVSMLLRKGAEVDALSPRGMTPLLLACQNGWTQAAEMLLESGADVNRRQTCDDKFPPIIFAAMYGHTSCVDMLIQRKVEVNYAKNDGFNALILAASFNQLQVVRQLVRAGARMEDVNNFGHTALLHASKAGLGSVVRALLQLGANPLHLDKEGHSALHLASKNGHSDVVSALLQGLKSQRDFNINLTTPKGQSALHLACVNGNEKVVRLLVDHEKEKQEHMGADQRMRDSNGRDAFAIAKAEDHAPVCVLLQPTREQMITTYSTLNTADAFMRARQSLNVENVRALKRELAGVGVIDKDVLSTRPASGDAVPSFFARLSSANVDESQPELREENEAMWRASKLKGQPFLLATWKPSLAQIKPPDHVASVKGGAAAASPLEPLQKLGKLGCVPLPNRHRFLLLNEDLSWRKFNVLVLGKSGAPNELNEAVKLIEDMKAEALAFAARSKWSKSTGLYFEPYPHASANALYLLIMDEVDPKTGKHIGPPEEMRKQLLKLDDVLQVLKTEREVEGAAWMEDSRREGWSVQVVCVSPIARNRGNLTLACMREVYSRYPSVINSLLVVYDDRDQDRKAYAPAFHFRDIPRPATPHTQWDDETFDYALAIGGMSAEQGASLQRTLEQCSCPFAANGTPGFNVGFGPAANELTTFLQKEVRPLGIVDDASAALIVGIEEHLTYISLLPQSAQLAAKQSRVTFPLTARGHTRDGAGSYGRQFGDKGDKPTIRNREWFMDLAGKYAKELFRSNRQAAESLARVRHTLKNADLEEMVENGDVIGDPNELGAILKVCDQFCKPEVIAAMHSSAERLFPILVECDETVGVVQSKIYDAKLVLSFAAKRAIDAGCTTADGTLATYATFGLAEPERPGGKSMVVNRELVRDLVFVLMSMHRPQDDGPYLPPDKRVRAQVISAIVVLAKLPVLLRGLMICDTGVDPNEDDLAAIMIVCNLNMLSEGKLSASVDALRTGKPQLYKKEVCMDASPDELRPVDSKEGRKARRFGCF